MRVALFTDTFDQVNGVANTFRRFADHCAARGVELAVFTAGTPAGREQRGSVSIARFRPVLPLRYYEELVYDLAPRPDLWHAVAAGGYDLAHLATPGAVGWHGWAAARWLGLRCVGSYHTELDRYTELFFARWLAGWPPAVAPAVRAGRWWMQQQLRSFYRACAVVLVPSPKTRAQVTAMIGRPVGYFHRGIDCSRFDPARRQTGALPRVLYVGRLSVEKNLPLLARLAELRTPCEIHLVGDGPCRRELASALPQAVFPGYLFGEELATAYASADVFVFPSLTDTLGNVVLEAKASGLPAVVLDAGGPGSLLRHGEDGFIARDADDLVARIDWLLAHPAQRATMGQAARRSVLQRNWERIFDDLLDTYRAVLAGDTGDGVSHQTLPPL
ncbi:MAG: glycosyltransferase family 1 protein [Fimbriimonadaceae bacterium]|nr:glycosyltransferase family 1 protein [Fimbriimonadaceae bacterium]